MVVSEVWKFINLWLRRNSRTLSFQKVKENPILFNFEFEYNLIVCIFHVEASDCTSSFLVVDGSGPRHSTVAITVTLFESVTDCIQKK